MNKRRGYSFIQLSPRIVESPLIFTLPIVLSHKIIDFLKGEGDSDNHLFATLRQICKCWPEYPNLHLDFTSADLKSRWHKLICEGKRSIKCEEITIWHKQETTFQRCCWDSLVTVKNLHVLNIDACTMDFRGFESLVGLCLSITSVDEALYLPSNLQCLTLNIPKITAIEDKDLKKLKIVCPKLLNNLQIYGERRNINNLPPIVINSALSGLGIGHVGIPRFEGELNINTLSLVCDYQHNLNEKNLPLMSQLTTLHLISSWTGKRTCFTDRPRIDIAKILNNLVSCQNVRELIIDLDEEFVVRRSLSMWHIQKWANLRAIVLLFEPDAEEIFFLKNKSKIMQIEVCDKVHWIRES
jgi:hypothetical protein